MRISDWSSDVCSSDLAALDPALVSPGLLALVGDDAPTRAILCAGGGHFARANVTLTEGGYVGGTDTATADRVVAAWDEIGVRAGVTPSDVGHVVMGQVIQSDPKDAYLARVAAVDAGLPIEATALTLNRLCGSGMQAIISAAQMITLGECDIAVAGGAESMSRSPHVLTSARQNGSGAWRE